MTPTKEMIAMAERIAGRVRDSWWSVAYEAALTAIMEVQQRVERELDKCCDPCPQCLDAANQLEAQQAEIARLRASLMQIKVTLEKTDKYGGLLSISAARKVVDETLVQTFRRTKAVRL